MSANPVVDFATPEDFIDLGESRAFELVEREGECAA